MPDDGRQAQQCASKMKNVNVVELMPVRIRVANTCYRGTKTRNLAAQVSYCVREARLSTGLLFEKWVREMLGFFITQHFAVCAYPFEFVCMTCRFEKS